MNQKIDLTLATLASGQLEDDFQEMYPEVLRSLGEGGKGSVSITIKFERIKDTSTMVKVGYEMKSKKPGIKVNSVAQIVDNNGVINLKTDVLPKNMVVLNQNKGAK